MIENCDVLVVIAHPDDELFVSGTLCILAESGFRLALVCVTDGENGSHTLFQLVERNLSLGEVRRRELALSAWALGVRDVTFFGQADIPPQEWGKTASWNRVELTSRLAEIIRRANPKLILTHGPLGGYGHPAHCEVNRCVMAAAREVSFPNSVFSFAGQVKNAFFSWRFDQPSNVLVESRGFLSRRAAALGYHQSSSEFFLTPFFPRAVRAALSALFGVVFSFSEAGRKRVPIMTARRFYKRYPVEGLVLQMTPRDERPHFFLDCLRDDPRVRIVA